MKNSNKEKALERIRFEVCTRWEETKRAQELRVEELSVYKNREKVIETILRLTSQNAGSARTDEF